MKFEELGRPKSSTMPGQSSSEIGEKPEALARGTNPSKTYQAGQAVAALVEPNRWEVVRIMAALEDARSGRPGVSHEAVEKWIDSWDTNHEVLRPMPER